MPSVLEYYKFVSQNPGREIEYFKQYPGFHFCYYPKIWKDAIATGSIQEIIEFYEEFLMSPECPRMTLWNSAPNLSEALTRTGQREKAIAWNLRIGETRAKIKAPPFQDRFSKTQAPDYLIIGSQKCATTSLYGYLTSHFQVIPAFKKEIEFFSWKWLNGIDWYLSHLPPKPEQFETKYITGEACPGYFDYSLAPDRVKGLFPNVKIIIILRDPVQRAISHYYHWRNVGLETREIEEAIQFQINKACLISPWDKPNHYICRGIYSTFLSKWIQTFGREQILVLKTEKLSKNPLVEMNKVTEFLGIATFPQSWAQQNFNRRWNVGEYLDLSEDSEAPLVRLLRTVQEFYEPHNKELLKILH